MVYRKPKEQMKQLILKKGEDRRIRLGHLWIFSNEVDTKKSPLKEFEPGESAVVVNAQGRPIGSAYVNPNSLICARMISNRPHEGLSEALLDKRISQALTLRDSMFDKPFYRMVFAEGDFLPGLVIDRYDDLLVAQLTTAGMEKMKDQITSVLCDIMHPKAILFRNDSANRPLEGLDRYVEQAVGTVPAKVAIEENGVKFEVPMIEGQKTGWFYDQRTNRRDFASFCNGKRVLDAFCYAGSFGCNAVKAGAKEVTFLDASKIALEAAVHNAGLNGSPDKVDTVYGDALDTLQELKDSGAQFDVICVDPPAFIKRKKAFKEGLSAYQRVNKLAMDLVVDGGIVTSCSCSQHLSAQDLNRVLLHAASKSKTRIQTLIQGHQGPDHPVHPAMPETHYLKSYTVRVFKS